MVGTGGLLVVAKQRGDLVSVRAELDVLEEVGYRLAPTLRERLLDLAGERDDPPPEQS